MKERKIAVIGDPSSVMIFKAIGLDVYYEEQGPMQEAANKQKRMTLKTIHQMLDEMSVELAEKVHLLFMANYIAYSDYEFRDEDPVES